MAKRGMNERIQKLRRTECNNTGTYRLGESEDRDRFLQRE